MGYDVIYSNRRTYSISVKGGRVIVRAPEKASRERISELVKKHDEWIKKQLKRQSVPRLGDVDLTDSQIKELKKNARLVLTTKMEYFSKIMDLKYGRITITSAKTRFGSCTSKGNISFSYRLMLYPDAAIDYVVVHELCHLVEMNHSKRFYALVEAVLPDYKERRKLLKK